MSKQKHGREIRKRKVEIQWQRERGTEGGKKVGRRRQGEIMEHILRDDGLMKTFVRDDTGDND